MGFLDDNFLLSSRTASRLYHEAAEQLPIVDAHNHLSVRAIAENEPITSITDLWLAEDHYKWRIMRAHGVDETLVTGSADPRDRFKAFAEALSAAPMNPLYVWSHLELRRVFGIETVLGPDTADYIYDAANNHMALGDTTPETLLESFGAEVVCTTDDPTDSLDAHGAHHGVSVLPTFRPDRAGDISDPREFDRYVTLLASVSERPISSPAGFLAALAQRHEAFDEAGCRASDHGLPNLWNPDCDDADLDRIWQRVRAGRVPTPEEVILWREWILREVARMDADRGWVMQLHIGPVRNVRSRLLEQEGPDAGADGIGNPIDITALAGFLNRLEQSDSLPRTVIYAMRPDDAQAAASIAGGFNGGAEDSAPGWVQVGPAWWFADTERGIRRQLRMLGETGSLAHSIGMVTDSRSLLSLVRHEYFRRILCDEIGRDVDAGLLPDDSELLAEWVRRIACENARSFFDFD